MNQNKNHEMVIKALRTLDRNIHYVIAGEGDRKDYLNQLAIENGVEERVHLLGYRSDVKDLYPMADIFVFPSFREGLSVSLMEAMASGLPCVVSRIRGNVDLIDENGGALFDLHSVDYLKTALCDVLDRNFVDMGKYNIDKVQPFGSGNVIVNMKKIYSGFGNK